MHVFELFLELKLYFLSFLRLQKTYFDYFKKLELGGPFGGLGLPPVSLIIQKMLDLHKIFLEYNVHYSIPFCATIAIQY